MDKEGERTVGRVAMVTGGTRGIGEAISVALKQAGYTVAASYAGNDEAANRFKDATGIPVYKFDVGDFDASAAAVKQIEEDVGPIEVLVNNAGITRDKPLHKMSKEDWDAVITTNLSGLFNMCRNVIDGMRERGFGRIVNISSINGQKGQFGQTNYAADPHHRKPRRPLSGTAGTAGAGCREQPSGWECRRRGADGSVAGTSHYLPHRRGATAGSQAVHPANPAGMR